MLRFAELSLRRGSRQLLTGVSAVIPPGERVGVTGANGTGKSSLFALLRGELHEDAGEFSVPRGLTIAHVAQQTPQVDRPAVDYVMDGDGELRDVQRGIQVAEREGNGHLIAELHARMEAIDGYSAPARAARLLNGLGFHSDQEQMPVVRFSGGWRMRLNLAQALMCRSDLLLLDEPTNHLDLDAVLWLESYLKRYSGTLLLISHDRDFLDNVCNRILHLERGRATLYTGNYSAFERQRAEQLALQQSAYDKQQREIAHIEQFVRAFRAKATKARQAQSRLKALERMERIAPAHVDSPFGFRFLPATSVPSPLLSLDGVSAGYGGEPVLREVELRLLPENRLGLLGHNGAGKSTLVKILAGVLEPQTGRRVSAQALRIGYFAQHQVDQLDLSASPLLHLKRLDSRAREQDLRDFLGGFGFSGERAESPVAPFSGGEKARLALSLMVYRRPNLLLLDEPTNHLDLEMRHALTLALQEFAGAMVLVSHDRHLLRTVTDELLLVHQGRAAPFPDDLDAYPRWLAEHRSEDESSAVGLRRDRSAAGRKTLRRDQAEQRRRLQPLRKRIRDLEQRMEALAAGKKRLEERLADPALYAQAENAELRGLMHEQAELARAIQEAEEAWLEASADLEDRSQAPFDP